MEQSTTSTSAPLPGNSEKNAMTLADWIGDMVALEGHIEEVLDKQLKLAKDDSSASAAIRQFHDTVKSQRDAIKSLQESYPASTAGNPIVQAGSALLGKAAGLVDMIRSEGISKALRDDYAAFSLANVGYTMLYTTATALGDSRVADLAQKHLEGYAAAAMKIAYVVTDVVVEELAKDDHQVRAGAADKTRRIVDESWKAAAKAVKPQVA